MVIGSPLYLVQSHVETFGRRTRVIVIPTARKFCQFTLFAARFAHLVFRVREEIKEHYDHVPRAPNSKRIAKVSMCLHINYFSSIVLGDLKDGCFCLEVLHCDVRLGSHKDPIFLQESQISCWLWSSSRMCVFLWSSNQEFGMWCSQDTLMISFVQ